MKTGAAGACHSSISAALYGKMPAHQAGIAIAVIAYRKE
jgi:hypothetical protein